MSDILEIKEDLNLTPPIMPEVNGLNFRQFRGKPDFPVMLEIINAVKFVDQTQRSNSLEDIANSYSHLSHCDPEKDLIFAEVNGEAVGYGRCWWDEDAATGDYVYTHFVFLKPEWRETEIGLAISQYLQERGRETAKDHPSHAPKLLQVWATETEAWNTQLYENQGFKAIRYGFDMERSLLEPLPEIEKPEGLEIRPYQSEQIHQIYLAEVDAFRDHWGFSEPTEEQEDFKSWRDSDEFQPHLWKIGWIGDEVAGMMLNFLNEKENEEYGLKRGYSENIATTRAFRRRGIASYLIVETMKMFKEMGMDHVALGVDAENPNGALSVYEGLGYKVTKKAQTFRKRLK